MTTPDLTAVLIVGDWTTQCSACGEYADPSEECHTTSPPGFSRRDAEPGCGARFIGVTRSHYARVIPGVPPSCGLVSEMRPDLPYVEHP